jgi:NAD+ kinase
LIHTVGLVLHPERDSREALATICRWAGEQRARLVGLTGEVARAEGATEVPPEELARQADLVVSLGGDGTMLRAMRLVLGGRAPVLGVNLGRLGFLAEIDVAQLPDALSAIDQRRFTVEPRSAVEAAFGAQRHVAFNEVALARRPGQPMAQVGLVVEGQPFIRYAADAVIVSTPTGSTAYSFSAGGPIVSPRAQGLVVTPVAPHSAFNRSLVLADGENVELEVLPGSGELDIEADGALAGRVFPGDRVALDGAPAAAAVVRLGRTTFYQRAQRKLRLDGSVGAEPPWPTTP